MNLHLPPKSCGLGHWMNMRLRQSPVPRPRWWRPDRATNPRRIASMPRSQTALSVRHPRHAATRSRRASHTAAPETSNPHNGVLVTRGFVLGRFPYAGPVPTRADW